MIKFIHRLLEEREFKRRIKTYQTSILPYVICYNEGVYELNIQNTIQAWQNEWEIIWFSDVHILLKLIPDNISIRIDVYSAGCLIKSLGLKKYALLLQDGYRYRLEEWRPKNTTYAISA